MIKVDKDKIFLLTISKNNDGNDSDDITVIYVVANNLESAIQVFIASKNYEDYSVTGITPYNVLNKYVNDMNKILTGDLKPHIIQS